MMAKKRSHKGERAPEIPGWILRLLVWTVNALTKPSDVILGSRREIQLRMDDRRVVHRRAMLVDGYVALWLGVEVLVYLSLPALNGLCRLLLVLPVIRTVEILVMAIRVSVTDPLFTRLATRVSSYARIVTMGMLNFIELMLCFGIIYGAYPASLVHTRPLDCFDPLYLSVITQFTIGYGDIHPIGLLRGVACLQSLAGFSLITLLIARFVSTNRIEELPRYGER